MSILTAPIVEETYFKLFTGCSSEQFKEDVENFSDAYEELKKAFMDFEDTKTISIETIASAADALDLVLSMLGKHG